MPARVTPPTRDRLRSLGEQAGFTLVEVLVSMVAGLVVAGALMAFLISSIRTSDGIASRSASVRQAESGFAQLTRDLRAAQSLPNSSATLANGVNVSNDSPVVITYTTGAAAHFTATFYLPNTATPSAVGTAVTWSCTAQNGAVYGKCTRQQGSATATEINGITSATITPTASSGSTIATATPNGGIATPPGTPSQYPTFVAVTLKVVPISQTDATGTHGVAGAAAIPLEAGVNLRAWS
jgi:prepilin-type N-terminal cleavage/methylation domain-containing protein